MELLETNDPKTHLLRKAAGQKQALSDEAKRISDKTEKVVKNVLIVGGIMVATYLVYTLLSDSSSKKKKKRMDTIHNQDTEKKYPKESLAQGVLSKVGTVLAGQASVLLLSLAKEKLAEYLHNRATRKDANDL